MWLLVFIFIVSILLIGWMLFGYLLLIWGIGLFRRQDQPSFPSSWPLVSVIVPCYNEQNQIIDKLEDIRKLDYPRDFLEVVFADGGSSDQTVELLTAALGKDEPYRVLNCPQRGKIQQLNHALSQVRGEIIINTDADSRLSPDALKWIAAEFASSPEVWVVGAYCRPGQAVEVEKYYWSAQNKGRLMETRAGSSSIVIAQCYAFRRELMKAFPDDVVADDVYVAFHANTMGYRTVYSRFAMALEMRSPQTHEEFLSHKFRKSNAFLRESLRFLYRLPEMPPFCKMMLFTRTIQQLFLPWLLVFTILLSGVLLTLFRYDILLFGFSLLLILFIFTSRVFAWIKLPDGPHHYPIATVIKGYLLANFIMLATGISYPFFRQGSSYARIGSGTVSDSLGDSGQISKTATPGT
jgi:cellulose synthase/poly-beta-1,6-N-acetylglucosamine synthase-like glycosyltransferase